MSKAKPSQPRTKSKNNAQAELKPRTMEKSMRVATFLTRLSALAAVPGAALAASPFGPSMAATLPEPATWAFLILGFGLVAASARRRRPSTQVLA